MKKLYEAIRGMPYIGPWVKWIEKYLGITGFSGFIIGFLTMVVLVGIGRWPGCLVSTKYQTPQLTFKKEKLPRLDILSGKATPYERQPEWFSPYIHYLEEEGKYERQEKRISDFMVGVVESLLVPATYEFTWVLKTASSLTISGFAFRKHNDNPSYSLQPLKAKKDSQVDDVIRFAVPESDEQGSLLAIVRVSWREKIKTPEFQTSIHSYVE